MRNAVKILKAAPLALGLLATPLGCAEAPEPSRPALELARATLIAISDQPSLPLLVPYAGLMVGIVDWSSYGVFYLATQDTALTEDDWTAAGLAAVNLIATSTLLSMPGSGYNDRQRVEHPDWLGRVADFQNTSVLVLAAVQGRDRPAFDRAADLLAQTCQSCHKQFKVMPSKETSQFAALDYRAPLPTVAPATMAERGVAR